MRLPFTKGNNKLDFADRHAGTVGNDFAGQALTMKTENLIPNRELRLLVFFAGVSGSFAHRRSCRLALVFLLPFAEVQGKHRVFSSIRFAEAALPRCFRRRITFAKVRNAHLQFLDLAIRLMDDRAELGDAVFQDRNVMIAGLVQLRQAPVYFVVQIRKDTRRLQAPDHESTQPETEKKNKNDIEQEIQAKGHGLPREIYVLAQVGVREHVLVVGIRTRSFLILFGVA